MSEVNEFLHVIERFSSKKILVIGDFILDVYLKGTSRRLSPEAPVPVVDVTEKIEVSGGAANAACNLSALGAEVTFLSVIGKDEEGNKGIKSMKDAGINISNVIRHPHRQTITKTRVMAGFHVLTRFDYGTDTCLESDEEQALVNYLMHHYQLFDAIVISDYNKGVITEKVLEALKELQSSSPRFVAVDSKRLSFFKTLKPTLVKPNYSEMVQLLEVPYQQNDRPEYVRAHGKQIFKHTQADLIAVTLDEEGSVIFKEGEFAHRSFVPQASKSNAIGAGDTYVSAMTLAAISNASIPVMADLATMAAAIAVKKDCTIFCNNKELKGYLAIREKFVSSLSELEHLCMLYRVQGKRIVFTNGCFDILHSGHVSYLNRAKELGDILIVGVNKDESIRRIKGPQRPINPLIDRMLVLSGLRAVDHIIAFGEDQDDTPVPLIKVVKPDIFVKGGDYTLEKLPEAETVTEVGGKIVFLSLVADHSTTKIIEQINKTSSPALL